MSKTDDMISEKIKNAIGQLVSVITHNITINKEMPALVLRDKDNGYFLRLENGELVIKDQNKKIGIVLKNGEVYLRGDEDVKLVSEKDLAEQDKFLCKPDFSVKITSSSGFQAPADGWVRITPDYTKEGVCVVYYDSEVVYEGSCRTFLFVGKGTVIIGENLGLIEFFPGVKK